MTIDLLIEKLAATGTGKPKLDKIREIFATVQNFGEVFVDEVRNWLNAVTAAKVEAILAEPVTAAKVEEKAKK
jgi:hypothetical protein